jgi:glycyl-tRNA synthetase alpha chain
MSRSLTTGSHIAGLTLLRPESVAKTFQDLILTLQNYWAAQGCLILQPYDVEMGAGTFHPATTLAGAGAAAVARRLCAAVAAADRWALWREPNRLQHYYQYQVILKPAPENVQDLYLGSLKAIGLDPMKHDVRFVEDDWESPTLGAWGLGWEVWCDGMEVTQFTYFQQVGGIDCDPVCAEITYGLERLAMYVQGVEFVYDLAFNEHFRYGEVFPSGRARILGLRFRICRHRTAEAPFRRRRRRMQIAGGKGVPLPAYDQCIKASHCFNLLDARGVISVTERAAYIGRVRALAKMRKCAAKAGWQTTGMGAYEPRFA